MTPRDWSILEKHNVAPDNLSVWGDLVLWGSAVTSLPDNLSVGGDLVLWGSAVTSLPDNLSVGGCLYLGRTALKNYPVVYGAGRHNRAIYLDLKDKSLICIGGFKGTRVEAEEAIRAEYAGVELKAYLAKVAECFGKYDPQI